jgi:hypothetical protein
MVISEFSNSRTKEMIAVTAVFMLTIVIVSGVNAVARAQELPKSISDQNSGQPNLSNEQIVYFLLNAKIIASKKKTETSATSRLTLSDGTLTHDGSFQPINESALTKKFEGGRTEINFRDSYHYNIAAYELAKLLGLGHMMPVTVERKWEGRPGSLNWWLPIMMDEAERYEKNIRVPDVDTWNKQMYKMRVFSELVYDTDRNLTNVLIGHDWKIYMVDFTRAFRLQKSLKDPKNLVKCDRQLFEKLRQLDENEVTQRTKGHLQKGEITALMTRRDKIVSYFQNLIAEKGASEVLY